MIQALPTGNFKWCDVNQFNEERVLNMNDNQTTGYVFDVDLEYPQHLHDLHNDYPLAAEKMSVQENQLSEHSRQILKILDHEHIPFEKLVPNLQNKTNYVIHYRNLKFYLQL